MTIFSFEYLFSRFYRWRSLYKFSDWNLLTKIFAILPWSRLKNWLKMRSVFWGILLTNSYVFFLALDFAVVNPDIIAVIFAWLFLLLQIVLALAIVLSWAVAASIARILTFALCYFIANLAFACFCVSINIIASVWLEKLAWPVLSWPAIVWLKVLGCPNGLKGPDRLKSLNKLKDPDRLKNPRKLKGLDELKSPKQLG